MNRLDFAAHHHLTDRAGRIAASRELAAYARGCEHTRRQLADQRTTRRTNRRLLFVAALVGVMAFCVGYLSAPRAAELHVIGHGLSHHTGQRTDRVTTVQQASSDRRTPDTSPRLRVVETEVQVPYQERNWGAGLRAAFSPTWSAQLGAYRNSYDRTSVYLLADATPIAAGPLRAGAFAGVVTGYPYNDGHATLAGGLLLRLQGERASAVLRGVPKLSSKQSGSTVSIELGWRL